jgi:hemerythrin-like domain-containing protein
MSRTEKYRKQHQELLGIASQIDKQLRAEQLSKDASSVRGLLSTLFGKLKLHLALEDKALYPELIKDSDATTVATARKFAAEMGSISAVVNGYALKWKSTSAIENAPDGFITETKGLFEALANRIKREDNELYALADKLK